VLENFFLFYKKEKTLKFRVFIGRKDFIGIDSKRASIGYVGF